MPSKPGAKIRPKLLILAALITPLVCAPVSAGHSASRAADYVRFKGAWFDIDYPRGWKAKASILEIAGHSDSAESTFFESPSGDAEFYVFSPQWNGDPKDIQWNSQREILVSHHVERASRVKINNGNYLYNGVANWYTVRAKDNSYVRSWMDLEDKSLNVRHVFGFKYRNASVYKKYQAQYAHFRRSLEQFSD